MTTVESCADPQTTPPTMDEVTGGKLYIGP